MDQIKVTGGKKLKGEIKVSGAKNAALPILISSLLSAEKCKFKNIPNLQDIESTLKLLEFLGATYEKSDSQLAIQFKRIKTIEAPYELVRKMRASVLVLGPLLAREGEAKVSLPGGCAIGTRPINYHLNGLKKLGAQIELESGYVLARAKKLIGNRVTFEFPSVGATENLLMAACLAKGETLLENCAKEPEIIDLAISLKSMGAKIEGEGTEKIKIQGMSELSGACHQVMGDRIEAGTFLIAGCITQGKVLVKGISPLALEAVLSKLEECGVRIKRNKDSIEAEMKESKLLPTEITTLPFPGFPTDMQAQFMAMMCVADGASLIHETIFENRFMHVPELLRMGADIKINGNTAMIRGAQKLKGAPVMATDLRASAGLILGALAAEGETLISRVYHLDRGYENIEAKLKTLGAKIERIKERP